MRLLILSDIHANAHALEAVLKYTAGWRVDGIISLGDHLNYGPMPTETLAILREAGIKLLMGNHEERLARMRSGDMELNENFNWSMLRWTNDQVRGEDLNYPHELVLGDMLLTHAVPGNLSRLIRSRETGEMDSILQAAIQACLVCGHNHAPWRHTWRGKEFICVGSLGMLEDNVGSRAAFALAEGDRVEMFSIPYDSSGLKAAFVQGGLAVAAPEFARVVHQTMLTGAQELTLTFMDAVHAAAAEAGIPWHSREAFVLAAERFDWTEGITCEEFWCRA